MRPRPACTLSLIAGEASVPSCICGIGSDRRRDQQLETNHLETLGDDGWFVYFRPYGPEQPFFDKSFKLEDFEMVD